MASKASIEAGQGHVTLKVDKSQLQKGLEESKAYLQAWGQSIASFGAAIAGAGAAITAPFAYGLSMFASFGSALGSASRRTGIEVEQLGALSAATGGDLDDLVTGLRNMSIFLDDAAQGAAGANRTLSRLGLTVGDLGGRSQDEQLLMLAERLDSITDAGERAALQADIFKRFGGNISGGRAGIEARMARARELGATVSPQDAENARAYNGAMRELGTVTAAIWREFGAVLAPIMTEIVKQVVTVLIAVRQWLNENRGLLLGILAVGAVLLGFGSTLVWIASGFFAAALAVKGVLFVLGAFAPILAALKGGFGLLSLVSVAWGVTTLFWTGLVAAATASYAVGHAITTAIITAAQWAYNAALAAYAAVTGAGTLATIVYTASLVVAWIWEVAVSGGLWLIVTAAAAAITALGALAIAIGVATGGWVLFAAGGMVFAALSGSIGNLTARFQGLNAEIGVTGPWQNFIGMLNTVAETAQRTYGAFQNAMGAGEMGLAWQTVVTGAMLAFEQIQGFAVPILYAIGDAISDVFSDAWTETQATFATVWGAIHATFLGFLGGINRGLTAMVNVFIDVLNAMTSGLATAMNAVIDIINATIGRLPATVRNRLGIQAMERAEAPQIERLQDRGIPGGGDLMEAAGEDVAGIRNNAENARIALRQLRAERDLAFAAGNADRVAALNGNLRDREAEAEEAVFRRKQEAKARLIAKGRDAADEAPGRPANQSVAGAFHAAIIAGFQGVGVSTAETRGEREARLAREALLRIERELERRPGVVMG